MDIHIFSAPLLARICNPCQVDKLAKKQYLCQVKARTVKVANSTYTTNWSHNIVWQCCLYLYNYTSFQRPASITENGVTANIAYNAGGERVRMNVVQGATTLLTRHYIGRQYEQDVQTNTERLYLGGDAYSAPAVLIRQGTGAWNIHYICRDHLGSITQITNANAATLMTGQEHSYDAWGRRRNPANHALFAFGSEPNLLLGRGFTGHEHLPWFGLINMNARLYDPAVGRFLSPDPFVVNPLFSQDYNRYTYCRNNPLVYTDPDGEFLFIQLSQVTFKLLAYNVSNL